jgi:Spondin_N
MKQRNSRMKLVAGFLIALLTLMLTACPLDRPQAFELVLTNLTHNQPMSPPVFLFHSLSYRVWEIGTPASAEFEWLAESGDSSQLLLSAAQNDAVSLAHGAAEPLGVGQRQILELIPVGGALHLTVAGMLVNTNDAVAAVSAVDLNGLLPGEQMTVDLYVLDAGTELNTEDASSVPGPVAFGEGYHVDREAQNRVRYHTGVLTQDDGLVSSVLNASHRFDNPAAQLVIKRL